MPNNLANATQPMDTTNLALVTSMPARPAASLGASADPEFCPIALAPIPPVMGTDTDAARQFYRNAVSQIRMPPLPAATKIAQGAQAATQVIYQVNGGGSNTSASSTTGVDLQVNNVDNPVQSILNLTGPGVSYGPSKGEVSIFATIGEIQNNGTAVPGEPILNFLSPLVVTDNPTNHSSDISISLATLYYQTVQQAGTSKPQEPRLNFLAPMTVTDDPGNTSSDVAVSVMVGDSGSGGVKGLVPAPPAGSGALNYLQANGTWSEPAGTGGVTIVAVDLTGQNNNIGATTIVTPGANGYYRISGWAVSTNTPSGGSIPAISILFTDADSNTAQTAVLFPAKAAVNAAGSYSFLNTAAAAFPVWSGTFYAKSGVAIQYEATSYAAGSGTALVYALHLRLEGPF